MKYIKSILKYLIVIVIISLLIYFVSTHIGFRKIYNIVKTMNPIFLGLAFLSAITYMLAWSLRDYSILRRIKKIKFLPVIPIFLSGVFLNTITPGARAGGEPVKAYYLSKRFKITKTKTFAATILNIIYNFMVFAVLCLFSILYVILYIQVGTALKSILILFLFGIPMLVLSLFFLKRRIKNFILKKFIGGLYNTFLFNSIRERFKNQAKFNAYINRKLGIFSKFIKDSLKHKKSFFVTLGVTCIFYVFRFLTVFLIFLGLGQDISMLSVVVVLTLSILLGDLSFLPGGIGITEGLMITLYVAFAIDPAIAVTVTLIDRSMEYFFSLFLGAISFLYLTLARRWD